MSKESANCCFVAAQDDQLLRPAREHGSGKGTHASPAPITSSSREVMLRDLVRHPFRAFGDLGQKRFRCPPHDGEHIGKLVALVIGVARLLERAERTHGKHKGSDTACNQEGDGDRLRPEARQITDETRAKPARREWRADACLRSTVDSYCPAMAAMWLSHASEGRKRFPPGSDRKLGFSWESTTPNEILSAVPSIRRRSDF